MLIFSDRFFKGFRTHVVLTLNCCTRCTVCLRTSAHLHACTHRRMAQVSVKKKCLSHECLCSLSLLLPSHVSPTLAVPARSHRDHSRRRPHRRSRPHVLAAVPRPESAGHGPLRTCIAKFGYLAKSDANTGNDDSSARKQCTRNHRASHKETEESL